MKNRKKLNRALFAIAAILIVLFPSIKREIIDIKVKRAIPLARYFAALNVKRYAEYNGKEQINGNHRMNGPDGIYIRVFGEDDVVLLEPVARINSKELSPFYKKFGIDTYTDDVYKNPSDGKSLSIDFYLPIDKIPEDFPYQDALLEYCGKQYLPCVNGTVYRLNGDYYVALFDWIKYVLIHESLWQGIF